MIAALHTIADAVLKRIHRSPLYYRRYNNTLDFNINKAYVTYARECAKRYAAQHGPVDLPPSPLENGEPFALRQVIPGGQARSLSSLTSDLIDRKDPRVIRPPTEKGMLQIQSPLKTLGLGILDTLRAPEMHRAMLQFFRGHYRLRGTAAWRTYPTDHANFHSWLWHCDTYPPHTCKIFLHLTPVTGETGATRFMNLEDTMAYRRAGYFGQYGEERLDDLETFAKEHGIPYRPFHVDAEPGDASVFNPNCLHRAVPPKHDFRDVVQLYLLPSPIPWEEAFERERERLMIAGCDFPKDPRKDTTAAQGMM